MGFYYINIKWYQKWWGVAILGLGGLLVAVVLFFAGLTGYYWWQIKQGNGLVQAEQIFAGFDRHGEVQKNAVIKREELESKEDPFFGNSNAQVTIVEFMDFKCPFSKEAYPTIKRLAGKFGSKIKFIMRDFPSGKHEGANRLAQIASCANNQGKFWNMSDLLFSKQNELPVELSEPELEKLAGEAGVNYEELKMCLKSGSATVEVNRDYADGFKAGVAGTPTFFVNGKKIEGVVPWEAWEKLLGNVK